MTKKYYSAEELKEVLNKRKVVTMTSAELKQLLESEDWIKAHAKTLASTLARLKGGRKDV